MYQYLLATKGCVYTLGRLIKPDLFIIIKDIIESTILLFLSNEILIYAQAKFGLPTLPLNSISIVFISFILLNFASFGTSAVLFSYAILINENNPSYKIPRPNTLIRPLFIIGALFVGTIDWLTKPLFDYRNIDELSFTTNATLEMLLITFTLLILFFTIKVIYFLIAPYLKLTLSYRSYQIIKMESSFISQTTQVSKIKELTESIYFLIILTISTQSSTAIQEIIDPKNEIPLSDKFSTAIVFTPIIISLILWRYWEPNLPDRRVKKFKSTKEKFKFYSTIILLLLPLSIIFNRTIYLTNTHNHPYFMHLLVIAAFPTLISCSISNIIDSKYRANRS